MTAKFALYEKENINPGSSIIVNAKVLPLYALLLEIFQKSRDTNSLRSCLLECSCTLHFLELSFKTAGSSEENTFPTTLFPVIDIVIVDRVIYGCKTFRLEQELAVRFFWNYL